MNEVLLIMLLAASAAQAAPGPESSCANDVQASAAVYRLSDLPSEIRDDLRRMTNEKTAESRDSPLLQTDAPDGAERDYSTTRFVQALLVGDIWFVQFDVSLFAGVRTIGYVRQGQGPFQRSPARYFGGPACETIKAALDGVYNPGSFNF